ncbi:hypothetical protein FB107DRAFT_248346 [Schizophyllum commune]|nr:hypothetical protein K525DRAFT_245441 [Schizophyllum commune Loenen D]
MQSAKKDKKKTARITPGKGDDHQRRVYAAELTDPQHLRNVEQANRGLQKTKVNYASYTADLKADLAATKVMNRELLKRARDLQASIRKVEAAVRECLQDGE